MKGTTIRRRFRTPRQLHTGCDKPKAVATVQVPTRAARMLALAHHIERLVGEGSLASYAEAAKVVGVTRTRLTQIMNSLLLAPDIQIRILAGELTTTERGLRQASAEAEWGAQVDRAGPFEDSAPGP